MNKLNVSNILYTHSDYKDVYNIYFSQQKKYIEGFVRNYVFIDKYDEEIPAEYEQIIYDDNNNYTKRLLECFRQIDNSHICLFQHEDMFLYDKPNIEKIKKYIELMNDKKKKIDFIKLIKSGYDISKQCNYDKTLYEISLKSNWIFSIQPSLWNTKRFIQVIENHVDDNIWEFETNAQSTCKKIKIKGFYSYNQNNRRGEAHWDNDIYPYVATAIVKGKWNYGEYQDELDKILKDNNIDVNIRGKYTQSKIFLDREFDKFWAKLEKGENFAIARNADGERAIMEGIKVSAQEGNWTSPNYISKLGKDIYNSLMVDKPNFYYALSCPCCDKSAYYWYLSRIKTKNITFANLWINANYSKFKEKFPTLKRDAVLIANYRAKNHKIGNLNILKHYEIDDDCISFWENNAPKMIDEIKKDFGNMNDLLYVVSAGPMSSPIIVELYKNNPNNCYIDFGSAIDIYYRENISRPYMIKGNVYAERNCWMDNPLTTNFDVSIVLNLFKRPENLELQLQAIEKQTLKPKEILLYQDGTSDTIKIPDNIKDKFDIIEIGKENKGVWERFRFAQRKAKYKYVCVFDDDTIPNSGWLENCHSEMLKKEGLYGTIGIIMKEPDKYPEAGTYLRVGWDGNLDMTTEVDFVGHSWFFKRDWLNYLFNAPQEIQKYKLCGEDMSFSFELANKNIKTFVPPHPKNNKELYGSMPDKAWKLGQSDSAISMSSDNLSKMKDAIAILLKYDWKTLSKRNPEYINYVERCLNQYRKGKFFKIQKNQTYKIITVLGVRIKFKRGSHTWKMP